MNNENVKTEEPETKARSAISSADMTTTSKQVEEMDKDSEAKTQMKKKIEQEETWDESGFVNVAIVRMERIKSDKSNSKARLA